MLKPTRTLALSSSSPFRVLRHPRRHLHQRCLPPRQRPLRRRAGVPALIIAARTPSTGHLRCARRLLLHLRQLQVRHQQLRLGVLHMIPGRGSSKLGPCHGPLRLPSALHRLTPVPGSPACGPILVPQDSSRLASRLTPTMLLHHMALPTMLTAATTTPHSRPCCHRRRTSRPCCHRLHRRLYCPRRRTSRPCCLHRHLLHRQAGTKPPSSKP